MNVERSTWTDVAAVLSIGAALVHAAAAGTHTGDQVLVGLFAGTALVQGAVGVVLLRAPSRALMLFGGAGNLLAAGAWVASRTVGLPVVTSLADREPVGVQDLVAAALAAGAVVCVVGGRRGPLRSPGLPRLAWVPVLALVPALVGVAAPHAHSEAHDHDHGSHSAAHDSAAHDPADGGSGEAHEHPEQSDVTARLAADPVLAGADTATATEPELTAAIALVEDTRAAVEELDTTEAAVAAGYVWIGDGRRGGGYQHYIHPGYLRDGLEMDPAHIESLVFQNAASGPVLVSTMYVLETGSTMDDVPEVAGDLTVWHDHQNLCWDASGTKLAGVSTDGETCRPAGELRATPPMLHVWLVDHDCGPFAGIEGHGGGDCATHEH